MLRIPIAVIAFAIGVAACDSGSTVSTPPDLRNRVDSIDLEVEVVQTEVRDGLIETIGTQNVIHCGFFVRPHLQPVRVGTVTLGADTLEDYGGSDAAYRLRSRRGLFDGRYVALRAAGNDSVAPFVDSLYLPPAPAILGPGAGDTIPSDRQFQLQWVPYGSGRQIQVIIESWHNNVHFEFNVPDNGSLAIGSEVLQQIHGGFVLVGLRRTPTGSKEDLGESHRGHRYHASVSIFRSYFIAD